MFSLQFFITSLVVVLIPGTGVVYTISTGLVHKSKYSIYAAIGCTLGIIPHLVASILGLSAIMNMSAQMFSYLRFAGAVYLFYLAVKTWKYAGKSQFDLKDVKKNRIEIIYKGKIINLLNPKLTLFFLSFLPQFIPENAKSALLPMIKLSLSFMLMTLIIFIAYGLLASSISDIVQKRNTIMKNIERSFAVIFAGLAVKLAISKE